MNDMFSIPGLQHQVSSARQVNEMVEALERRAAEDKIKRMGAKAQIEFNKILADQRMELEEIRSTIVALLKHNLEQAEQQSMAAQERDKIEAERYKKNLKFTKIAAWTGIIGGLLGVITIVIQLFH